MWGRPYSEASCVTENYFDGVQGSILGARAFVSYTFIFSFPFSFLLITDSKQNI